ncbi:MAG: acetyl xylan esterase [Blastococcus sp.]|nr:acetyl xylan esterase [Blastococcus sp.]
MTTLLPAFAALNQAAATAQTVPLAQRNLPDALTMRSGAKVTTANEWPARRKELLELFRTHVYGRAPIGRPDTLRFRLEKTDPQAMGGIATLKQIAIEYHSERGKGRINLVLFVPNRRTTPAPAFMLICNRPASNIDPTRQTKSEFWPAEQIVARGYAAAAFQVDDVAPDTKDAWQHGAHHLFDPPQRAADAWGTIAAWAWGASRAMDYLVTDKDIDALRVAVVGHSRGGKTALWAGAQDTRFALVISNDSGSTGAALARGKSGETIADINKNFPHWFAQNYKSYNSREDALPVDQHQLIALIAPRPAYIASATQDTWADPASEFLAGVAASPVYKLWNREGLPASTLPKPGMSIHNGFIGYHLREGGHNLTLFDWQNFMTFADLRMKSTQP